MRLFLGEGEFDFALRIDELIELEQLTGDGIGMTHSRLSSGAYRIADLRGVIRLGLIGAGADKKEAHDLTTRHVKEGYLADCVLVARAVTGAAIVGSEDEPMGEGLGETS